MMAYLGAIPRCGVIEITGVLLVYITGGGGEDESTYSVAHS